MSAALLLGIDVGSTSVRAGLFDATGRLRARAEHPFAINRPAANHAEHDSDEIWAAVARAVRDARRQGNADPTDVASLAFDATCSLVMLDAAGRPASASVCGEDRWNVVMWADHRAIAEAEEITATGHRVLDYVGGVMSPEMQLPKLLWLKRHLPDRWPRYALGLDLADFLVWRATGAVRLSACTVTCKWTYLNHEAPGWQHDFLAAIGLGELEAKLSLPPRVMPVGAAAGRLSPAAAEDLGLTTQCTVGVGMIDAHAGGLGLLGGIARDALDGRLAVIAGTSNCHMAVSPVPRPVAGIWGPYYGAMLPDLWLAEGGQSATGALLDHVLDWHAEGRALGADRHTVVTARILELVAARGPDGVLRTLQVLPDFHGNRSPLADPTATGAIHGLTLDASFDSLARLYYAAAVGIALGTRHIVDALNRAGWAIDHLHLTGGHAASALLTRLYADATGCTVVLPEESDGVLLGTAIVAAAAAGLHDSLAAAGSAMSRDREAIHPDPATRGAFDRRYRAFLAMHEQRCQLSDMLGSGHG